MKIIVLIYCNHVEVSPLHSKYSYHTTSTTPTDATSFFGYRTTVTNCGHFQSFSDPNAIIDIRYTMAINVGWCHIDTRKYILPGRLNVVRYGWCATNGGCQQDISVLVFSFSK